MNTLNAFVEIPELADNTLEKIGKFGEFSVKARTYTKDIRNYADKDAFPNIELTTTAILDETSTPVPNPPAQLTDIALSVSNFFYTQYSDNAIPLPPSKATLESAVAAEVPLIRNVRIGEILEAGLPGKRLIDQVRYDCVVNGILWRVTLWFSDSKFREQYPLYDIVVIPPLGDIDRMIDTPANVVEAIKGITVDYTINRIAAITSEHSSTTLYTHTIKWNDPNGSKTKINTKWTVVIYGAAGNDLDIIKDAIRRYIADNSTSDKWPIIFPDLYSENEFLLMPLWDVIAAPADSYDDGLYASLIDFKTVNEQAKRVIPLSYTGTVAMDKLRSDFLGILSTTYRGLLVMTLGNPNNVDGKTMFDELYPDYMAVSTDRPDFARMSTLTQDFVIKLIETLDIARHYTLNASLDGGYTKATKGNREYIGFDFEGFTYYVLTRTGYLKSF